MRQVTRRKVTEKNIFTAIFDMNNICKISSVNHDMNNKGEEYGMVVTALRIIGDVLKKKDFDYCIGAYDGIGSGVLRWKYYKDYKANRGKKYELHDPDLSDYHKKLLLEELIVLERAKEKKRNTEGYVESEDERFERQKYILQNILEELCIRQYEFNNVEGDDIIAYYVNNKKENEKIVIVSSDKDLTQLISDNVIIYNPRIKDFITKDNSIEKIGITHENVVLEKMLCGDVSDNIKGVKGMGEQTLLKLFPNIINEKADLSFIIERSKELLRERKESKKKPLKSLENIINGVTDGCQGDNLYEINRKIIDLSEPLLTDEAKRELDENLYGIIDTSDRDIKNIYNIIRKNDITILFDEDKFGNIISPYSRIIMMEKKRYKNGFKQEKD